MRPHAGGGTLAYRYFGRLPESGRKGLKAPPGAEVFSCLSARPDLKAVAVADGAPDGWSFLESLSPDAKPLDFCHAAQHPKAAADAAFGPETAAAAWFERQRQVLRHDPEGIGKAVDAQRHPLCKGREAADIERESRCFRRDRPRMHYADAAAAGFTTGSGAVESANRDPVTSPMKRSGQSWGPTAARVR